MAVLFIVGLLGCESRDEIRAYHAPKLVPVVEKGDAAGGTDRMLAAIAARDGGAWFFKMVGPSDAVQAQAKAFRDLIESLQFAGGKPKWTLPEGWQNRPGSGIRFATLEMKSGETELELSVTSLPKPGDVDDAEYYLANINRWRGQVQVGPLSLAELNDATEQIEYDGGTAIFVDIVGNAGAGGGMNRPPLAGLGRRERPMPNPPAASTSLKFEQPESWEAGELVVSRGGITIRHEAAFSFARDEEQVEITIDRMPALSGTLANVNRWRRQVGLAALDESELRDQMQQIEVAGKPADYVQLEGEEQTILGVLAEREGQAWFIKLKGDKELATAERERFETFVQSIRVE